MIKVTDVKGNEKYINCDLIERMEATPDTVLFFVNGNKMIVHETPDEIIASIVRFKRLCGDFGADISSADTSDSVSEETTGR